MLQFLLRLHQKQSEQMCNADDKSAKMIVIFSSIGAQIAERRPIEIDFNKD